MTSQENRPKADEIPGQKLPYPAKQSDMHPALDFGQFETKTEQVG